MVMVPAHKPDLLSAAQLGPGKFAFVSTEISLLKAASLPCAGAAAGFLPAGAEERFPVPVFPVAIVVRREERRYR